MSLYRVSRAGKEKLSNFLAQEEKLGDTSVRYCLVDAVSQYHGVVNEAAHASIGPRVVCPCTQGQSKIKTRKCIIYTFHLLKGTVQRNLRWV
jgi:hypothetical protein